MSKLQNLLKVCAVLVLAAFIIVGCGKNPEVVATVNGQDITKTELDEKMEGAKAAMELQGLNFEGEQGEALLKMMEQEVLYQMIQEAVIAQEAEKEGIKVDAKKAQEQLDQMKELYGADNFKQMLEAQKTDEKKLKEYILFGLTADELYKKATADVKVTEEKVKEFFEKDKDNQIQIKVSHILAEARDGEATPEELKKAEEKAKGWIKKLEEGADFAELAKAESDEPAAKTSGGALEGFFSKANSMYDPDFTAGSFKIAKGTFSKEPVKSSFGYHVIKVEERKDTFEQLKDELTDKLEADEKSQAWGEYLTDLMQKAEVENKLEEKAQEEAANQDQNEQETNDNEEEQQK